MYSTLPQRNRPEVCALLGAALLISCAPRDPAPVLLFDGRGTSPGDVAALEAILQREGLRYDTVGSFRLNRMTVADLRRHRLLLIPGGNFEEMGNALNADATANVREAVHEGLNYLGICAGAFLAGNSPFNSLNLTGGVRFGFYSAEAQGIRKAAVPVTDAGGAVLDQYWEDGPELSGWGAAAARYPDGAPAIAFGRFGNGWVVLAGIHPEAPESWRRGLTFRTAVEVDRAYAARLIRTALSGAQP